MVARLDDEQRLELDAALGDDRAAAERDRIRRERVMDLVDDDGIEIG
jgi:hypothetical protein